MQEILTEYQMVQAEANHTLYRATPSLLGIVWKYRLGFRLAGNIINSMQENAENTQL